ncbi:MAG TPA: GAF domain-containing sensor histidine kinase [Candidatus Dormibacteraeota bacterium]|nr:GAF domain-containing sensor histidine kinase [Candidatus Dormibacteraeota bacterium]
MTTRDQRTAALIEAGVALSSELSLSALLQRIVELAVEVTGARYGALGVVGPDGALVDFITTGLTDDERLAIGPLPRGRGILGALIDDAQPLRLRHITDDPRSVGFPPNHPPMVSFLGAPIRALGMVFGNIYLTEKQDGAEFTEDDKEALVTLATQAGVAVANARLYADIRLREQWLEAVRDISGAILAGDDVNDVLHMVAGRARALAKADHSSIVVPTEDGRSLRIAAADGEHAAELQGMAVPTVGSLSGEVITTGRPLLLADTQSDSRAYLPMVTTAMMGPTIMIPLSIRGRAFGSIAVSRRPGSTQFRDEDLRLMESFADQAALGLEYGRAQRELARLTLVEDRERIAKELHDGVIQSLFAVGLGLQGTAALIAEARLAERIQDAVGEIDRVIGDLRNYIFGLRPHILAGSRLAEALDRIAIDFQEWSGVTTVVDVDESLEIHLAENASHVVQFTREALSNVGKHAGATTCRVSLRRDGDAAVLEIDDDGSGFDIDAAGGKGMGMDNMRNRSEAIGGSLLVTSTRGEGTTVRVRIPV